MLDNLQITVNGQTVDTLNSGVYDREPYCIISGGETLLYTKKLSLEGIDRSGILGVRSKLSYIPIPSENFPNDVAYSDIKSAYLEIFVPQN